MKPLSLSFRAALLALCGVFALSAEAVEIKSFTKPAVAQKDGSFAMPAGIHCYSTEQFKIDTGKVYRFSIEVKGNDAFPAASKGYAGFLNYDKDGKRIEISMVYAVKGTMTSLAAACNKNDTVIKVKDGSRYKPGMRIAYGVADDLSDLPNKTVKNNIFIKKVTKQKDFWELTLNRPCNAAYPAGTKVRAHNSNWYQYTNFYGASVNKKEWKKYTLLISGQAPGNPSRKWTQGTASVKLIVFTSGKRGKGPAFFFRNVKLEDVTAK